MAGLCPVVDFRLHITFFGICTELSSRTVAVYQQESLLDSWQESGHKKVFRWGFQVDFSL